MFHLAGAGILPGATFTSQEFVDWFEKHFARGAYDGVALLGSHALLDEQGCVKSAEIAGEGPPPDALPAAVGPLPM
jgi:hypothetical protein